MGDFLNSFASAVGRRAAANAVDAHYKKKAKKAAKKKAFKEAVRQQKELNKK